MSIESIQAPLFPDPIGERFRRAREKKQWSKQVVAQQLRLPVVVIDAIENEDWTRLGAPIYVRSYVGSYARILGLPPEIANDVARDKQIPKLQPIGGRSHTRSFFDRSVFNLASLGMTGIIVGLVVMLAMYFNTSTPLVQMLPIDPPASVSENRISPNNINDLATTSATTASTTAASTAQPIELAPVMGSLAPLIPSANTNAGTGELILRFHRQSWVEVVDAAGQRLEHSLIPAGTERRYRVGQAASIVLGDASAVEVNLNGQPLDTAPYQTANMARFTVSSQGQISPPGD